MRFKSAFKVRVRILRPCLRYALGRLCAQRAGGRLQTHTLARSTHTLARALTRHGPGDARVGQGVCWSADRTEAWELQDGEEVRDIPLDEASKIAERIGLPPP